MSVEMTVYAPVKITDSHGYAIPGAVSNGGYRAYRRWLDQNIEPGASVAALDTATYPGWIEADDCPALLAVLRGATSTGKCPEGIREYHDRLLRIIEKAVETEGMVRVH